MSKAFRIAVVSVAGVVTIAAFGFAYLSGVKIEVAVALAAAGIFMGGVVGWLGLNKP